MSALDKILELRSSFPHPNPLIKEGLEDGKKLCGWLCMQAPEEIIEAGGVLPFRVLGDNTKDTSIGDAHLYSNNCPYTRACMATALRGVYKDFDGLIGGNLCDHVRRLADEYKRWVDDGKEMEHFFFWVPFKRHEDAILAYKNQLVRMKETVEAICGKTITDDDLKTQIEVYDEMRDLFMKLAEYRKQPNPPILGSEFMDVILAAQQSPKAEFNKLLRELVDELKDAPGKNPKGPRIVIVGSELDDPGFLRVIENAGAQVVGDDLCTGNGYFWNKVRNGNQEEVGDPLYDLAKRYLTGIVCPRMTPPYVKHDMIKTMIRTFKADAIIYTVLKFCEPHVSHWKPVKGIADEAGLPILWLERDYMASGAMGQFRTRVEAFMEQMLDI
jgi:benzoyl-CoA reductase/2-hydroxyglutaryl-CoA dehydratase subunit BcrC/BadD/HgdB